MIRGVFFSHRDQNPMRTEPSGAVDAKGGSGSMKESVGINGVSI